MTKLTVLRKVAVGEYEELPVYVDLTECVSVYKAKEGTIVEFTVRPVLVKEDIKTVLREARKAKGELIEAVSSEDEEHVEQLLHDMSPEDAMGAILASNPIRWPCLYLIADRQVTSNSGE